MPLRCERLEPPIFPDGSEAVILARSPDVCSFPDSGGKADILQPLLEARSGPSLIIRLLQAAAVAALSSRFCGLGVHRETVAKPLARFCQWVHATRR